MDAVSEWVARKATHVQDPFTNLDTLPAPFATGMSHAIALTATGQRVASSSRVQKANGRVYFPVQDCNKSAFVLSDKRWR